MSFVTVLLNTNTQTPRRTTMSVEIVCILFNLKQSSPAVMPSSYHAVVYKLISRLYKKKESSCSLSFLANTPLSLFFAATSFESNVNTLDNTARTLNLVLSLASCPRKLYWLFTWTI